MARIIIFGGHGKVALFAEPLLVAAGDEVSAVIRNPDQAEAVAATGATPVVADVESMDLAALTELIGGHDAVVWSAGAGGGSPERTRAVDFDAATLSMQAAAAAGVQRYVMVSWFGSRPDHGIDPASSFFAYAQAKADADEALKATDLDWTILGPSGLTLDPPTGRIDARATASAKVARADVAAVIVAVLGDPRTIGRTIRFNAGSTPIAEAIQAGEPTGG